MNELYDKLILRLIFTIFICLFIILYRYGHSLIYPSLRSQLLKRFYPSQNAPNTIHLFARILGIGIIFSEFYFHISEGIWIAIFDFSLRSIVTVVIFLLSIYLLESVVLYNFEYSDEIIKRKNFSYAIISFSLVVSVSYILKTILMVSGQSFIFLIILWLLSIVLLGVSTRTYKLISPLPLNKLVIQKNLAIAYSYSGFILGWTMIISSSLAHQTKSFEMKWYFIQVLLKILLSLIIFPIFRSGLVWTYRLKNDLLENIKSKDINEINDPAIGYGVYEGVVFFTSCFLTTVITGQINFGTFYPVF